MMMRQTTLAAILALTLAACTGKDNHGAEALMQEIRNDYEAGNDSACLVAIDTLRAKYPTAIAERKEALEYFQKASERMSQKELERTDRLLTQENERYAQMERTVARHKAELCATADELTALTMQRMRRDSLQARFDVLCQQIRFIHKRQNENR